MSPHQPISLETLRRFDRPGPRYTSYPTAVEFAESVGAEDYERKLRQADGAGAGAPLSLYVHIPFCRKRCNFCACHVISTPHREVTDRYLDYLEREVDAVAERLPGRRQLAQMHWGGGTPTYLSPPQIERLFAIISRRFTLQEGAEVAVEVDPRVTTAEHLSTLSRLGFNRLSIGLQDPAQEVQEAIGRHQTWEQTVTLVRRARRIGFSEGVNVDLIYGLPGQRVDRFASGLDDVLELMPDRLAVYSFAYVPWIKPNQRRLAPEEFPDPAIKLELYLTALNRFLEAGYDPIGMDHFALPGDELSAAAREGRLERNFMGYTVKPASTMIGFGVSAIGDLEGGYFQNCKKLSTYYRELDAGRLPVERGCLLDGDDRLRRRVIMSLMCSFRVDKAAISERFGIEFDDYFRSSLSRLGELEDAEMVRNSPTAVEILGAGKLFVRNAAMAFDRYLEVKTEARPAFSRTV